MTRKICELCGRFYEMNEKEIHLTLCDECRVTEKGYFDTVREYLYNNHGASALEIANATGVPLKAIDRYIREGRIMYKNQE